MKANVISAYTDRETGEPHRVGEQVELTDARAAELSERGFVEPVEAPKPAVRNTRKKAAPKAGKA